MKKLIPLVTALALPLLLTACTSTPVVRQVQVEAQITAPTQQTYEIRVLDGQGVTRLDALLGPLDRTAVAITASNRYRVLVDVIRTAGDKKKTVQHTPVCRFTTKAAAQDFVIIVAKKSCAVTYKS